MMGIKERRFDPLPYEISLEDLVPKDNFYRRLDAALDLSFVRDMVRPLYARGGRPSVDPVVFFRLQLVMFFEDLRSERQLMRVAADRLSVRWYLGYDLHEPLPNHSNLTRTRERFGLSVFRLFFERIVEECAKAGLVRGDELFFDSTKVEGNAAMDSLAPRWAVEAHLGGLFEEGQAADVAPAEETDDALPSARDAALWEANAAERDWISRDGAQDRSFQGPWRARTSDTRASRTDPDATPMTWAASSRRLGYQAHYVVDGGKARIILNTLVAPAEVTENRPMLDLLWRTCFRWKLRPHHVTADGKYGTLENVAALRPPAAYIDSRHFRRPRSGLRGQPKSILQQAAAYAGLLIGERGAVLNIFHAVVFLAAPTCRSSTFRPSYRQTQNVCIALERYPQPLYRQAWLLAGA